MKFDKIAPLVAVLMLALLPARAQYFGRNKANYEKFNFEVYQTPNFDIYHYLKNPDALNTYSNWAEQWYGMHQRVLGDTIYRKNPIVLYNNHADFQQTNAISGAVGVGTGGVTEALKNRVILPFAMSNQQSFHVLGHEMVHAFQYNMVLDSDSTSLRNLANLPLWMVEGLAEYMSIGSFDAHTAMWMRDAVLRDDVPTLKDLQNPKYFPYRYGQAFWSFVTSLKGDEVIAPLFKRTAMFGLEVASQQVLGMTVENLSELWVNSVKQTYTPYLRDKKETFIGKELISNKNGGELNIAPTISPNGRYVIFLSEKDLFSIDLFLFDINENKIVRKVASSARSAHIDDFNYIESAGAWSPDSKQFAFVGFSKGRNILIIKDVESGRTVMETALAGLPAFSNPNWSPDGRTIVVAGLSEGQIDLFTFDVRTQKVKKITDSWYSELLPHFNADGSKVVYSTDQLAIERGRVNGSWYFNLAQLDLTTGATEMIDVFPGADNLNPVVDPNGNIIFLSNRDGYRNIYEYEVSTGKVYQLTDYLTGVSGITQYAPALSMAAKRERLAYTYFTGNKYQVYLARPEDYLMREIDPRAVDFTAEQLPRPNANTNSLVDAQLDRLDDYQPIPTVNFSEIPYKAKFKLDYIASSGVGVGVGTSPVFGTTTGVAGGVDMLFSDILGNNTMFASASLNGEIYDFGAALAYINRKSRINWGASLSHIPFRSFAGRTVDTTSLDLGGGQKFPVVKDALILDRIFEDQLGVFTFLPFSRTMRVEASASFSFYSFRREELATYFERFDDGQGNIFIGAPIGQDRNRLPSPSGFKLGNIGTALVSDNSFFGLTAPLEGHRYRIGVDQYFGDFQYTAPTLDFRIYRRLTPVTLAFRAFHYGRYGGNANEIFPIYLGSPWYVRGFNTNGVQDALNNNPDFSEDNLFGSKILVGNFEVRFPFSGPERLAAIKSSVLFSDLNFFIDGGLSWFDFDQFKGDVSQVDGTFYDKVQPIFSVGTSLRVNLFGALILEPYYAFPLIKEAKPSLGLNIIPGW